MKPFALTLSLLTLPLITSISCIEYGHKKIDKPDGRKPEIFAEPELVDFGYLEQSAFGEEILTLGNKGEKELEIDDIRLNSVGPFTISIPSPIETLAPDEEAEVIVRYAATNISDESHIRIQSNDPSQETLLVPIVGRTAFPMLSIEPSPYMFEWTEVGQTREGSITLVSSGRAPVTVENMLMLGTPFSAGEIELALTIEPGDSVDVPVFFFPYEENSFDGEFWVSSDGLDPSIMSKVYGNSGAGSISGRICDTAGEGWVVNAKVFVSVDLDEDGEEDFRVQTHTDAEGRFTLDGLPGGTHTIQVQKGSFSTEFDVDFPGGNYELQEDECLLPESVKIAVVGGDFDHIESLLSQLQLDYDPYGKADYLDDLLLKPEKLAEYDIIFFNCGMPFDWLNQKLEVSMHLREYAANGGSVYASDWAHAIVEATWPQAINFMGEDDKLIDPYTDGDHSHTPYYGGAGTIIADVPDPIMRDAIGSEEAELWYDLEAWVVPLSAENGSTVMVQGDAPVWNDIFNTTEIVENVPLAIQFAPGGRVIFTTFHNEPQISEDMKKALKEIILTL